MDETTLSLHPPSGQVLDACARVSQLMYPNSWSTARESVHQCLELGIGHQDEIVWTIAAAKNSEASHSIPLNTTALLVSAAIR